MHHLWTIPQRDFQVVLVSGDLVSGRIGASENQTPMESDHKAVLHHTKPTLIRADGFLRPLGRGALFVGFVGWLVFLTPNRVAMAAWRS